MNESEIREAEERRLAVELKIILGFENIVEDAEAAANARFATAVRIPGEAELEALWRAAHHRRRRPLGDGIHPRL